MLTIAWLVLTGGLCLAGQGAEPPVPASGGALPRQGAATRTLADGESLVGGLLPAPREVSRLRGRLDPRVGMWVRYEATAATDAGRLAARLDTFSKHDPTLGPHRIMVGEGEWAEPPDHREGYAIRISPGGLSIAASDVEGLYRGEQTVEMLLDDPRCDGSLPCLEIRDWPEASRRAAWLDLTGEKTIEPSRLHGWIEQMARFKLDMLVVRLDSRFGFEGLRVSSQGAFSKADLRELADFAHQHHVALVPQVDLLDGMNRMLVGPYAVLQAGAAPGLIDPSHPATRPFLEQVIDEVCPLFGADWVHGGFATGPDRFLDAAGGDAVTRITLPGAAKMLARHLVMIRGRLAAHGKRLAVWSDGVAGNLESLSETGGLERLVVFLRRERSDAGVAAMTRRLVRRGAEVILSAPGETRLFPRGPARASLGDEIERALDGGAMGGCVEIDPSGPNLTLETAWWGLARAAARLWNPHPLSRDSLEGRFARAFFGVDRGDLARTVASLDDPGLTLAGGLAEPVSRLVARPRGPRAAEGLDRWSEQTLSTTRDSRRRLVADRAVARRNVTTLEAADLALRILEQMASKWRLTGRAARSWNEARRLQAAGREEWTAPARACLAEIGGLLTMTEALIDPLSRSAGRLGMAPSVAGRMARDARDLEGLVERIGSAVGRGTRGVGLPSASVLGLAPPPLHAVGRWHPPGPGEVGSSRIVSWDVTALIGTRGAYAVVLEETLGARPPLVRSVALVGSRAAEGEIRVVADPDGARCWVLGVLEPPASESWRLEVEFEAADSPVTGIVYLAPPEP